MKKFQVSIYHQTITAALLIGGTFNLGDPDMAVGNKLDDTTITNTATITYGDFKGRRSEATSNAVNNTLVEIGNSNTFNGILDINSGSIQPNNVLNYNYVITNIDNTLPKIFIPSTVTVTQSSDLFSIIHDSTKDDS